MITSPVSWPERSAGSASLALLLALGAACGGDGAANDDQFELPAETGQATASSAVDDTSTGETQATADSTGSAETGSTTSDEGPTEPPVCIGDQVTCGSICADLGTDVSNCGLCGRTCIIANAQAGCVAGECVNAACDQGFSDCDGLLANGCEAPVECGGGPCMTRCGSTGVARCSGTCESVCSAPLETCNAIDDNCDGQCDEGPLAGCRIPVHRSVSPTLGHFYTTDLVEAASGDLSIEAQDFYFLYAEATDGLVVLFRCLKGNNRRFYTSSTDCEGTGAPELTMGYMAAEQQCGAVPLYRVHQPASDDHFYTLSAAERDNAVTNLGYQDQGITGYVWANL